MHNHSRAPRSRFVWLALALPLLAHSATGAGNPSTSCLFVPIPPAPPIFLGDQVRVSCDFGAGTIDGGVLNQMTIPAPLDPTNPLNPNPNLPVAFRFALDCVDGALGGPPDLANCVDEGPVLSFVGNATTNCPGATSVDAQVAGNEVAFTFLDGANAPTSTVLPMLTTCNLSWDVRVENVGSDATPQIIQAARTWAGQCDTAPTLFANGTGTIAIPINQPVMRPLPGLAPLGMAALGAALAGLLAWRRRSAA